MQVYYKILVKLRFQKHCLQIEVKYIQETPSWMAEKTKYTEVYAKVTKFKLRKTENGYNINSVEVISINSVN